MALITCKDCKKEFSTDAKCCPHCGAKNANPHYILKGAMILLFIVWIVSQFDQHDQSRIQTTSAASISAPSQASAKWIYFSNQDAMTSKDIRFASIESINTLYFDFPYNDIQHATLQLRTHPRYGKDIIFSIEKGQFLCRIGGCSVLVRFDDDKPIHFRANEPSDNSTTYIFISDYADFIRKLQKAKKVKIAAEFYQNGFQTLEFDVSDFDQNKYIGKSN